MKNVNFKLLLLMFTFIIFWFVGTRALDPDFGWRLRSGLVYLTSGIPKTDPFSYTMPSFPWVDHAWLTTASIGWFYQRVGKSGLALLFTMLVLSALLISSNREKEKNKKKSTSNRFPKNKALSKNISYFASVSFLLSLSLVLPFSGVRAQLVTWLMLAIFLRILLDEKLWSKWRILMPPFFLVWANLHGGFLSGLAVFYLVIFVRAFRMKRLNVNDIFILLISSLLTLSNP